MQNQWQWLINEINSTMRYVLDGDNTDAVEVASGLVQRFWAITEDMPHDLLVWCCDRIQQLEMYVEGEGATR